MLMSYVHNYVYIYYIFPLQIQVWSSNFRATSDKSHRSMKLYEEMKKFRKPSRSDTCEYVRGMMKQCSAMSFG